MQETARRFFPIIKPVQLSGFFSFFEKDIDGGFYFAGEHHDFWEVVYCLSGEIGVSSDENVYALSPGDVMIHRPNEFHKIWTPEGRRGRVLIFSFTGAGELLVGFGGAYSCPAALQTRFQAISRSIKEAGGFDSSVGFLEYMQRSPRLFGEVTAMCEGALALVAEDGLPLGFNRSKSALDYKKVVTTMQQNLSHDLSLDELGDCCGLSVSAMKALFRTFNDKGVHEYYLWLRMTEAAGLLGSGLNVTEVADRLGFSSQSYFSTAFRRVMGVSPSAYRARG